MIEFNVNNYVRVKLNDRGRKILEDRHNKLFGDRIDKFPYRPKPVDEDGWTKYQLWSLMEDFGPHISIGCNSPFETTIQIVTDK